MSYQPIRFYQTGTFTVGNRLLGEGARSVQANMRRTNSLNSGHRACQGCGEALGARYAIDAAMEATQRQLVAANATGCLEVFSTPYPETSWQIPWIHSLFGNQNAIASGLKRALSVRFPGRVKDVVVLAGDIYKGDKGVFWARQAFPDKEIIYVPGNHEFYRTRRTETLRLLRAAGVSGY